MKVLLTGGGTLGPVTPLLAVAERWKEREKDVSFVWVGTPHGPEHSLVEEMGIRFYTLPVARFPRYVSLEWVTLPFKLGGALLRAAQILSREKPDVVGSAGGYTALPVILAARAKGIPVWVHQQDVKIILTNRLTAPFANLVTLAWETHVGAFSKKKTVLVGNPARRSVKGGSSERAQKTFDLNRDKKTVLIFGGGSGSHWLNEMTLEMGESLADRVNVIHLTGLGKMPPSLQSLHNDLCAEELLTDGMADALAVADVVVSRAGLGTITELAALKKAAILIPLPDSPQEMNADAVRSGAAVLEQSQVTAEQLRETILVLMEDDQERKRMGEQLGALLKTDVADELIDLIESL